MTEQKEDQIEDMENVIMICPYCGITVIHCPYPEYLENSDPMDDAYEYHMAHCQDNPKNRMGGTK